MLQLNTKTISEVNVTTELAQSPQERKTGTVLPSSRPTVKFINWFLLFMAATLAGLGIKTSLAF